MNNSVTVEESEMGVSEVAIGAVIHSPEERDARLIMFTILVNA